jgi:hypothetical protein
MVSVLAKIQIGHLPNTNLEHYCNTTLLGCNHRHYAVTIVLWVRNLIEWKEVLQSVLHHFPTYIPYSFASLNDFSIISKAGMSFSTFIILLQTKIINSKDTTHLVKEDIFSFYFINITSNHKMFQINYSS